MTTIYYDIYDPLIFLLHRKMTLLETNISPFKGTFEMVVVFVPFRCDVFVCWRFFFWKGHVSGDCVKTVKIKEYVNPYKNPDASLD